MKPITFRPHEPLVKCQECRTWNHSPRFDRCWRCAARDRVPCPGCRKPKRKDNYRFCFECNRTNPPS